MRSVAKLTGLDLVVLVYSTLSRRSKGLKVAHNRRASKGPIAFILESTGLKMHGGNGRQEKKRS